MNSLLFVNSKNIYSKKIIKFLRDNKFKLKVIWTSSPNEDLSKKIGNWKGDFIFHLSSYYKIPEKLLKNTKKISINFHTAPPKYPGRGGYSWALINNDNFYGITVHKINKNIDNGEIIYVYKFKISKSENLDSLINKTKYFQYLTFIKIIKNYVLPKYVNHKKQKIRKLNYKWSKKKYTISMLDKIQNINIKLPLTKINKIEKIILSTTTKNHRPKIIINKHKFTLE